MFSNKNPGKPSRKGLSQELIDLVLEYKNRNPKFGYLRIAMQISNQFGIEINDDVVRRILKKHYNGDRYNPGGPSWLIFLGNAKDSLWSLDLFRVESINLTTHWVLVVMDQYTRRIIGFAVHKGWVDGLTLCLMFNKIISKESLPKRLSSDNASLFKYHKWKANLRVVGVEEIKTVPYTAISHPFVERLIRSVREDLLNNTFFWNTQDLQQKLDRYKIYFNEKRAHFGIDSTTPENNSGKKHNVISINNYKWEKYLNGLSQLPIAA